MLLATTSTPGRSDISTTIIFKNGRLSFAAQLSLWVFSSAGVYRPAITHVDNVLFLSEMWIISWRCVWTKFTSYDTTDSRVALGRDQSNLFSVARTRFTLCMWSNSAPRAVVRTIIALLACDFATFHKQSVDLAVQWLSKHLHALSMCDSSSFHPLMDERPLIIVLRDYSTVPSSTSTRSYNQRGR